MGVEPEPALTGVDMSRPLNLSARDLVFIALAGIIVIFWVIPTVDKVLNGASAENKGDVIDVRESTDARERISVTDCVIGTDFNRSETNQSRDYVSAISDYVSTIDRTFDIPNEVKTVNGAGVYEWTIPSIALSDMRNIYVNNLSEGMEAIAQGVAMATSCYYTNGFRVLADGNIRLNNISALHVKSESGRSLGRLVNNRWIPSMR